jgi:hypothetical protein
MSQTQEQKDIIDIKEDINSIRMHLDNIKKRQDTEDTEKIERNRKIDSIYNSLTDNQFNSNQGYITTLRNIQTKVLFHDLLWRLSGIILIAGGVLAGLIKLILFK